MKSGTFTWIKVPGSEEFDARWNELYDMGYSLGEISDRIKDEFKLITKGDDVVKIVRKENN